MLILVDEVPPVQLKAGTKDRPLFHAIFNACAVVEPLLCSSVLGCVEAHLLVNQGNFHLANSDQALLHLYRDDQGCTARWVGARKLRSLRSMCASLGCIRGRFGYMHRHCAGIGISPGSVWILPGVRPREERPSRCFFPACVPRWELHATPLDSMHSACFHLTISTPSKDTSTRLGSRLLFLHC